MNRIFDVTAASDEVRIDGTGKGEIAFTVTNVTGRPIRGRAQLVSQDTSSKAWLALSGDSEREFPLGGTQQFTVKVSVPPGVKSGKYNFRLDLISVNNPDEDYAQGPNVGISVTLAPTPARPFPWWILAVVAAVMVIGVGLAMWLSRKKPAAPPPPPKVCRAPAGQTAVTVPEITAATFSPQVLDAKLPVAILFWAPWSGPARAFSPQFARAAQELAGCVAFGRINVDDNPTLSDKYKIKHIPSVLIVVHGQLIDTIPASGTATLEDFEKAIDAAVAKTPTGKL